MKIIIIGILVSNILLAKSMYSKVEPYRTYYIQAEVAGKIEEVKLNKILTQTENKEVIISIDDYKEEIELEGIKERAQNLKDILKNKKEILKSIYKVKSKSRVEKLIEKNNVLTMENSLSEINQKISILEETIKRKKVKVSNKYIKEILVDKGTFVGVGSKLIKVSDIETKKIEYFLTEEEVNKVKSGDYKLIKENNKEVKVNWKVLISKIKDEEYISGYKVEFQTKSDIKLSSFVKLVF